MNLLDFSLFCRKEPDRVEIPDAVTRPCEHMPTQLFLSDQGAVDDVYCGIVEVALSLQLDVVSSSVVLPELNSNMFNLDDVFKEAYTIL
jgi:hypothetical protein